MKKASLFFIALMLISCHSKVKKEELSKVNGYWEIKKVVQDNGETKDYKINETIDYFEVKNNLGFRQKVMPQFDGKYKTNGIQENIKIIDKDNEYYIEYATPYGKWQEQIVEVKDSTLILRNKDKIEYQYKRFTPFSLK
jgi:hypothetical protein